MTQIIGTNKQSKCMYCGSNAYGFGCPYSPHKKHVHSDDPKRCIYCGATGFGVGCPYNPFSKMHVHGVEYNQMMKESVHSGFTSGVFLYRLTQPITETAAFKMGLVDEEGRKLRNAATIEEQAAFTPLDAFIFRLRRIIGEEKLSLLNSSVIIEMLSVQHKEKFDQVLYEKEIKIKSRLDMLANEYKMIVAEGTQQGLSTATIENLFVESIIGSHDDE